MKICKRLPVVWAGSFLMIMVLIIPLARASSSKEAKGKVDEAEKALGQANDAARREKNAEDDWFEKQSEAFQDWLDANKKEEEAQAAREKAEQTGNEKDIKAAERAEKIAKAAREKADKSEQIRIAAEEALNQAKAAKEEAKEKAAKKIPPAEEAVDGLPESSVKKKLKERIQKIKDELNQFALAPKAPGTVETAGGHSEWTGFTKVNPNFARETALTYDEYGQLSRTKGISVVETSGQPVMKQDIFQQYDQLGRSTGTQVVTQDATGASPSQSPTQTTTFTYTEHGQLSSTMEISKPAPEQTTVAKLKE